jgi:hypothetical protein
LSNGIDQVYAAGGKISGGGWTVQAMKHYGFDEGHYFVDATIDSAPQQMIRAAGAEPQSFPGAQDRLRAFVLERGSGQWKVSELDPAA